jgi:hypothetical protein
MATLPEIDLVVFLEEPFLEIPRVAPEDELSLPLHWFNRLYSNGPFLLTCLILEQ